MSEKPLHVRVAEALGWTGCAEVSTLAERKADGVVFQSSRWQGSYTVKGTDAEGRHFTYWDLREVPRYDTDWAATGPLIERFGFELYRPTESGWPWRATKYGTATLPQGNAATPLEAVCNLILVLAENGELPLENESTKAR